ncbi:MAG TPA: 5,10-methylenetetrahydrofolate reductase [Desulfobacterales bacterium]|nr:5,10-methylenetetrahydrofolate reductase [Desulfobacterales bacterium]
MAKSFEEALTSGKFLVAASLDPPKGTDLGHSAKLVKELKRVVDALGVSDNPCAVMHMSPWAVCRLALEQGVEPIMHVTCRDRNRLALQSDLLAAASIGIKNILCVSGDHVKFGDHPDAKPSHDIDSVHLLGVARAMAEGKDMVGNPLTGSPAFCLGATANPEADPLEPQLIKVDKKIQAGASFLVTHPVFNMENLKRLMERVRHSNIKVLAGVRLLVPEDVPKYRDGAYPGLFVPEEVLEEIDGADTAACVEIAGRLLKDIKSANLCDGVHITAPRHEEIILDLF